MVRGKQLPFGIVIIITTVIIAMVVIMTVVRYTKPQKNVQVIKSAKAAAEENYRK